MQILVYIQNHTVSFSFSSISVSFALCVAFGAKIKSVIEPDGVEDLFFLIQKAAQTWIFQTKPFVSEL